MPAARLDSAGRAKVRRMVYANSGSVYGETLYRGLPRLYEDTALPVPVRLYSITKQAAERTCIRMRELWNVDVVSARLGNVIGPWERDTGVRDRFEVPTELMNPLRRIKYKESDFDASWLQSIAPMMAVVVGLGIRKVGD